MGISQNLAGFSGQQGLKDLGHVFKNTSQHSWISLKEKGIQAKGHFGSAGDSSLPRSLANFLSEGRVAGGAGLESNGGRPEDSLGVLGFGGLSDGVGPAVEVQGEFGETGGSLPHPFTHLLHPGRGFDQGRGTLDLGPVLLRQSPHDALDRDQVAHHVLFLVPGHHRSQGKRIAMVESVRRLKTFVPCMPLGSTLAGSWEKKDKQNRPRKNHRLHPDHRFPSSGHNPLTLATKKA